MKRLFVPFVALATVLVFTSCGGDITFTGLDKDLTIDLGDRTAALEGVSAKGKSSIPKEDITIIGLDFVGEGKLTYTAKEDSETGTDTRNVTVKPDKLFATYKVVETYLGEGGGTDNFDVVVKESSVVTKLIVTGFMGNPSWTATFVGDGKSMDLTMERLELGDGADKAYITGSAKYLSNASGYSIYQMTYEAEYSDESPTDKFSATLEKR